MKISSKKSLKAILAVALFASSSIAFAQGSFSVGADLVSSYVWRGVNQDLTATKQSPNIQPYVSYAIGGLTVGAWGSTSLTGTIKEFDLYATYAITDKIAVTLTDYNWNFSDSVSYFKYAGATGHVYEVTLAYAGTESLPLSASINTIIGGLDKNSSSKQAYSSYLELGYQLNDAAKLIVGGSLIDDTQIYGGAGVTNVSLKVTKSIELSDKFSLPVYGIAGFNTVANDAFLVLGITL
jgi:hypothetical protein